MRAIRVSWKPKSVNQAKIQFSGLLLLLPGEILVFVAHILEAVRPTNCAIGRFGVRLPVLLAVLMVVSVVPWPALLTLANYSSWWTHRKFFFVFFYRKHRLQILARKRYILLHNIPFQLPHDRRCQPQRPPLLPRRRW